MRFTHKAISHSPVFACPIITVTVHRQGANQSQNQHCDGSCCGNQINEIHTAYPFESRNYLAGFQIVTSAVFTRLGNNPSEKNASAMLCCSRKASATTARTS